MSPLDQEIATVIAAEKTARGARRAGLAAVRARLEWLRENDDQITAVVEIGGTGGKRAKRRRPAIKVRPPERLTPCIMVRIDRGLDQYVVTGRFRLVTGPNATFQTGRNAPAEGDTDHWNWLQQKTYLEPELSSDPAEAFVFAHPADAASLFLHCAGGCRMRLWSTRKPGLFRPGEYVSDEMEPGFLTYLRITGAAGPDASNVQIMAAYRTLIRAGLADDLPDADWIRQRAGIAP